MRELLFFIASSFWAGAAHTATPGHGKTIAAAYIVGARGKPIDAVILEIFVTLSHVSGIVLVGVLASLGSAWLRPQRIEAYLAVVVGILVIVLGLSMLWAQRDLVALAMGEARTLMRAITVTTMPTTTTRIAMGMLTATAATSLWSLAQRHGFGKVHAHRLDVVAENRPKLPVLLALGIAGGLLPDPAALALLLGALSSGKVMLALSPSGISLASQRRWWWSVSLPRRSAKRCSTGRQHLDGRLQIATSLLIIGMGVVLTIGRCPS